VLRQDKSLADHTLDELMFTRGVNARGEAEMFCGENERLWATLYKGTIKVNKKRNTTN
jgi:hypothetical protein